MRILVVKQVHILKVSPGMSMEDALTQLDASSVAESVLCTGNGEVLPADVDLFTMQDCREVHVLPGWLAKHFPQRTDTEVHRLSTRSSSSAA